MEELQPKNQGRVSMQPGTNGKPSLKRLYKACENTVSREQMQFGVEESAETVHKQLETPCRTPILNTNSKTLRLPST